MGFVVALVTGRTLLRLLRMPRRGTPQPLRRRAVVRLDHAHAWVYARTRGRLGGRVGGHPVLLLTTRGRRTGAPRRTPVQYEQIDGEPILVAAAGGAPEPPAWWHNLVAEPAVTVQIGAAVRPARAATVGPEERAALWAQLCERNPQLDRVRRRAGRELPLVRLTGPAEDPRRQSVVAPDGERAARP
jgi:deazaflavin-dependent oxidoreductase (nitroreductase family)